MWFGRLSDISLSIPGHIPNLIPVAFDPRRIIIAYPDDLIFSVTVEGLYHLSSTTFRFGPRHTAALTRAHHVGLDFYLNQLPRPRPTFPDHADDPPCGN
jgi:hypothetical protein